MSSQERQQKFVVITGANGGIGEALCETFAAKGYNVIATDIQDAAKSGLQHRHYVSIDLNRFVADEGYGNNKTAEILTLVGESKLHCLINNAAVQILGGVDSLSRSEWQTTLNVNLQAPFFLAQAFTNKLEAAKGSVVNISSIHAKLTKKNFVAYATSKAALSGMTRAMAVDLGPRIRVNAIEPAAIKTAMLIDGFKDKPEKLEVLESFHPVEQLGKPAEVAQLAHLLAESSMRFMSGEVLSITGGIRNVLHDPA
ncbi:MAG: SDR family oxidoreductase [Aliidiomarina sp.]|uniref:SDR family NAD(P)-dependent oxidoreductase n=1 Tax=Aliidiomarina sp. TaxID=1872439 RepID=UPI0025BDDAFC|nr:SDR family oxidoreductase [Aliidiomarina sp.]MCH8502348.1 SDR family oxidoreductase [Aliidiomarina sp.]